MPLVAAGLFNLCITTDLLAGKLERCMVLLGMYSVLILFSNLACSPLVVRSSIHLLLSHFSEPFHNCGEIVKLFLKKIEVHMLDKKVWYISQSSCNS